MNFSLGPWSLGIETDAPLAAAVAEDLAPLRLPDEARADFTVRWEVLRGDAPSPLRLPPDAAAVRWGSFRIFRSREDVYLDFHETALFRVRRGRAEGVLYYDPRQERTLWIENILLRVIVLLLRPLGATLFHASGWVDPRGATLFTASNGSGKSTLALVTSPPCGFLGDDLVVWDGACVWAFPKPPRVGAFAARALGLPAPETAESEDAKRRISAPPHAKGPHQVAALWFPEILPAGARARGEGSRVLPISGEEAQRRIRAGCEHSGRDGDLGAVEIGPLERAAKGRILLGEDVSNWKF